jgi:threonine dehydrogenase-like Zn-dependent dehydrogenase
VTADLAPRQGDEVLVRALYSGISRGTESLVFRGEVPESERDSMRAPFQEGDFPGPVKYGYASVGEVVEGPAELEGRAVFSLYPHQDLYRIPEAAVVPLPEDVPAGRAVLAANAETALNATWDAEPVAGDRVVVIGAGVVGLLTAWLLGRVRGTPVTVYDIDPSREAAAEGLGLDFSSGAPVSADADLLIHASGSEAGLRTALASAAVEATILELSWYGDRCVSLPLGEAFHSRRLTLRSSQVGRIPPHRSAAWDHRRRLEVAVSLLTDPRLDVLIGDESPFEELPQVMERLSRRRSGALCHRIRYDDGSP